MRNLVESRMIASGNYQIISCEEIDTLLENQRIQVSSISSKENITKLQLQNINYIVTGSVDAVDSDYLITVKILDVSTGQFSHSADEFMEGTSRELINGVRTLVGTFIAGMSSEKDRVVQSQPSPPMRVSSPPVSSGRAPAGFVCMSTGAFTMGSPSWEVDRESDETQHSVSISKGFYISDHEVTQKEWYEVMGTTVRQQRDMVDESFSLYGEGDDYPMYYVSWYEAVEYCNKRSIKEGLTPAYTIDKTRSDGNNTSAKDNVKWVVTWNRNANGYRLPTEAEWEFACRAGTTRPFYTGNNITTDHANYNGNNPYNNNAKGVYRAKTWVVKSGTSNAWELYDMSGNVWEWCWDWYGAYGSGSQTDPSGVAAGSHRVVRGGSWGRNAHYHRSAIRGGNTPSDRYNSLGFRLLRP